LAVAIDPVRRTESRSYMPEVVATGVTSVTLLTSSSSKLYQSRFLVSSLSGHIKARLAGAGATSRQRFWSRKNNRELLTAVATRTKSGKLHAFLQRARQGDCDLLGNMSDDQMAASVTRPPSERQIAAAARFGQRVGRSIGEDAKQDWRT
jgi:hypothetical protein